MAVSHYPSVYLDTNILSYLHYSGHDILTISRHIMTRDWWENERQNFRLYSSRITMRELETGKYEAQTAAVAQVRRIVFLSVTDKVSAMATIYLNKRLVPESKRADGLQLALATVYGVDYLLSWNHAHLIKWETQKMLLEINSHFGYGSPLLVTPENIPQVRMGQRIKRKKGY